MTNSEALQILGLPISATPDQIQAAYTREFSEIQAKITNASSSVLRERLEKNMASLQEAYATLKLQAPVQGELAATTPLVVANEDVPQPAAPILIQEEKDESEKLKKQNKYLFGGLVVAVAVISFLGVQYFNLSKKYEKIAPLEVKAEGLKKVENNIFKLQNKGKEPFTLFSIKTFYYDEKYEIQSFEDNNLSQTINAEASYTPEKITGNQTTYDGKAIFYAVTIIDPESTIECPRFQTFTGVVDTKNPAVINFDRQ